VPTSAEALFWPDVLLDVVRQDPGPSAALMQGLFFGRIAPPKRVRRTITTPALVIGHGRDPIHPSPDSDALAEELPNARLLRADSFVELRAAPRGSRTRSPTSSTSAGGRAARVAAASRRRVA
jgi:pimeloyl-ACP methyl ester carboxylesterase